MFRSYLTTAFRNLWRRKSYTVLHILGLSIGLATCLLVYLYVQHELSFDTYHPKADRTYRINYASIYERGSNYSDSTPLPLAKALRLDFPQLEHIAMVYPQNSATLTIGQEQFNEKQLLFVEPSFLDMFAVDVLVGDAKEILAQPNQALLSKSTARKYFGEAQKAIGQRLEINSQLELEVAGIFEDSPSNTHLPANIMISVASFNDDFMGKYLDSWGLTVGSSTFITLPPQVTPTQIEEQLVSVTKKYLTSDEKESILSLQALKDIHLDTNWQSHGPVSPIRPIYLWIFGLIGFFVLLLACINFINLATAQAVDRSREVSVRKVMGAQFSQLITQYMSEAYLITFVSIFLSVLLAELSLPFLNQNLGQSLVLDIFGNPQLMGFLLISFLGVGLCAGFYPAFVLSRYEPAKSLKTQHTTSSGGSVWLRRSLVTAQFLITFVILIGTLVVNQQLSYCKNKDLGFEKDAILMVDMPKQEHFETLRSEWLLHPRIEKISYNIGAPTANRGLGINYGTLPRGEGFQSNANLKTVDEHYSELFGLKLLAGRLLNKQDAHRANQDSLDNKSKYAFVVNETLVRDMGYTSPEEILGQRIFVTVNNIEAEIVGVVQDFNMSSLHSKIRPMIMVNYPRYYARAAMKVNTSNLEASIAHIKEVWTQQFPEYLFEFSFVDDQLARLYDNESRLFFLFSILAGLAIFIGCLGLWGLVAYTIQQRTKEIGVRKILGATAKDIVLMLSNEFTLLIMLAFLLAAPIAWYLTALWLQNFSYSIQPGIGVFLFALLITLIVAWLTVSYKSIRAALFNPVDALRHE
ncbi:MAG: ABC transporter permease [Bacteroidota bacterium]